MITSLRLERKPPPDPHFTTASGTPGPAQRAPMSGNTPGEVMGEAPWALSALPECFRQIESASGSPAFARAKIPGAARRIPAGDVVVVADCTLAVGADRIRVTRGTDRLLIPPVARLYRAPSGEFVLDRRVGRREDVRVYAPSAP